jgi:hypothetical protein
MPWYMPMCVMKTSRRCCLWPPQDQAILRPVLDPARPGQVVVQVSLLSALVQLGRAAARAQGLLVALVQPGRAAARAQGLLVALVQPGQPAARAQDLHPPELEALFNLAQAALTPLYQLDNRVKREGIGLHLGRGNVGES